MPTVTVSSRLSDAVYLVSVIGLAILLSRPVYLAYSGSQARAAQEVSSGLAEAIDSMSPGTSMTATLQTYPAVGFSVSLSGTTVAATFGRSTAMAEVRWHLPKATLTPGEPYTFTLEGGKVTIGAERHG